ncbi:type I-B CRISPR-associated protein Cas7/Cst2/DevR [soil metagenome]
MSLHVFANFITPFGTAANNRAETEGNITTLQKILWMGETHSTVSAEAIRFAVRRRLGGDEQTNRSWDEHDRVNTWQDHTFKGWSSEKNKTFIDDDLLGYMIAEAAKEDGGDDAKGTANVRRAVLEVTRAISLTPWAGDVTFNAASPGATPSAQKKGNNPVPYGTEVHATRYQYGVALTPERLRDKSRAAKAIEALCNLGTVAGNHGRFLFDFSPEAVVIRLTADPAPRLLYCFDTKDDGKTILAPSLVAKIGVKDIDAKELILGVSDLESPLAVQMKAAGVEVGGVKAACAAAVKKINAELKIKE